MATVFDVFKEITYSYLTIIQSSVKGDVVAAETEYQGIFKEKGGSVQSNNMEALESTSTLHVHPEDFNIESCLELIGNGVTVNGQDYSIVGATTGTNFDNGEIEHYRLTLEKANFVHE